MSGRMNEFSRTQLMIGEAAMKKLAGSTVAVFGIGGVGGYCVEALVRCGIGKLVLFDDDVVCLTNINRQIIATHKTIGKPKVDVMRDRILEINPMAQVEAMRTFYSKENADEYDFINYDYVIDAIDTVSSKLLLVEKANTAGTPILSCMGAGNKLDPSRFEITDIYKTSVCPLAKVMRHELRKRGVKSLKVLYSREDPIKPITDEPDRKGNCVCPPDSVRSCTARRQIPGSISFVPSTAGLIIAGEVVRDLIRDCIP